MLLEMIVKEKKFVKGEYIWRKGEKATAVYIVKEGECIYEKNDIAGKVVRSGDFIGETLCIAKKTTLNTSLKAVNNSTLLYIDS